MALDEFDINPLWRHQPIYTVEQAALLIAGYEPAVYAACENDTNSKVRFARVVPAMAMIAGAIEAGELRATLRHDAEPRYTAGIDNLHERGYWRGEDVAEVLDKNGASYVIDAEPNWSKSTVTRPDLVAWLSANGVQSGIFFSAADDSSGDASARPLPAAESAPPLRIKGETFARLARAVQAFPARYPNYQGQAPKLDRDLRPWLKESKLASGDREAHVFGAILAEHFGF